MRRPPKHSKLHVAWPHLVLALLVTAYAVYFSAYQIARHEAFYTNIDLANMEQTIWNTLHGRFMRATIYPVTGAPVSDFTDRQSESRLADHVQPILLVLALPYALIPRSEIFGVMLSLATALGAVPLYNIARRRLGSEAWALFGVALYLLLPTVETTNAWDPHGTSFLPPLLLAALDTLERGKRRWWWFWTLLAMGCREDIPLLTGWAMLCLAPRDHRQDAAVMASLGTLWSCVAFLIIIPYFGGDGTPYPARFFPSDTTLTTNGILTVLRQRAYWARTVQHSLTYNIRLGLPVLFLYWLHVPSLLAMAPTVLLNGLSWYIAAQIPDISHYSAPLVPWMIVGTLEGFVKLNRSLARWRPTLHWRRILSTAVTASVLGAHVASGYTPLSTRFSWPAPKRPPAQVRTFLAQIPEDAAISAEANLAAHLARRETLRLFPDLRGTTWIILDQRYGLYLYFTEEDAWKKIQQDPSWKVMAEQDGLILLRRARDGP